MKKNKSFVVVSVIMIIALIGSCLGFTAYAAEASGSGTAFAIDTNEASRFLIQFYGIIKEPLKTAVQYMGKYLEYLASWIGTVQIG